MRLLIRSFSTNDQIDFGAFAVVSLSDDEIRLIAKRRKAFVDVRSHDNICLLAMHFHVAVSCGSRGAYAHFYGGNAELARGPETLRVAAFLDGEAYVALGDHERIVSKPPWSVCHRMIVGDDWVRWYAIGGTPNTSTTTAQVPFEILFTGRL
jgi:hypothetical protein